jgi:hypothetical protein
MPADKILEENLQREFEESEENNICTASSSDDNETEGETCHYML